MCCFLWEVVVVLWGCWGANLFNMCLYAFHWPVLVVVVWSGEFILLSCKERKQSAPSLKTYVYPATIANIQNNIGYSIILNQQMTHAPFFFPRSPPPSPANSCSSANLACASIFFSIFLGMFFFSSSICANRMDTFSCKIKRYGEEIKITYGERT